MDEPKALDHKLTDTIPRVRITQVLGIAALLAERDTPSTFDVVRSHLLKQSARSAPGSREAMWAIARDVLSELSRLGYGEVGPLPRKRSEVLRLSGTPCALTSDGRRIGMLYKQHRSKAFDDLLIAWLSQHPYFRKFTQRILAGELFVPDITSIRQVATETGEIDLAKIPDNVLKNIASRLPNGDFSEKWTSFSQSILDRFTELTKRTQLVHLDAKKLVDIIEDAVVLPSFLDAENIPCDAVTFQHLLRAAQDFLSVGWTASHPNFTGRVVFRTCSFVADENAEVWKPTQVIHHGVSFAERKFAPALIAAYHDLVAGNPTYVDAYALRAIVCTNLKIQPIVFERCLASCIGNRDVGGMKIFTELPFTPPPTGEDYIKVGSDRIGLIKLSN